MSEVTGAEVVKEILTRKRQLGDPGVKDLLITRQNALGIAKDIMIAAGRCPINPEQDEEFISQLKKVADQLVAYDWRGIQLP